MRGVLTAIAVASAVVAARAAEPARSWSRSIPVGTNHLIRSLAFLPDNGGIVVGCDKGVVKVFDDSCPDRLPTHVWEADSYETKLAVAGDGKRLVVTGCPGVVSVFDVSTGKKVTAFELLVFGSFGLSPDGTRMWADDSIHDLTGTNGSRRVRQFEGSEVLLVSGTQIITAKAGKISFWNLADGKLQREFDTGSPKFTFHSISGNGYLVIADANGVHIWDLACDQRLATVPVKDTCHDAVISPDGKRLVTNTGAGKAQFGKHNYSLRVWEVATGKELQMVCTSKFHWPIAMSPRGQLAYTQDGCTIEFRSFR